MESDISNFGHEASGKNGALPLHRTAKEWAGAADCTGQKIEIRVRPHVIKNKNKHAPTRRSAIKVRDAAVAQKGGFELETKKRNETWHSEAY